MAKNMNYSSYEEQLSSYQHIKTRIKQLDEETAKNDLVTNQLKLQTLINQDKTTDPLFQTTKARCNFLFQRCSKFDRKNDFSVLYLRWIISPQMLSRGLQALLEESKALFKKRNYKRGHKFHA